MSGIWMAISMAVLLIGFGVSAYFSFTKFKIENYLTRVAVFLSLGVIISLLAFTVSLTIYTT